MKQAIKIRKYCTSTEIIAWADFMFHIEYQRFGSWIKFQVWSAEHRGFNFWTYCRWA